jgi:N-acetylneuraminic acid mutarotase
MAVVLHAVRFALAALFGGLVLSSSGHAQKWVSLAPFPEAAEEVYGIASGGKMYVFGGLGAAWSPMGMVYEYDPAANRWTKKKPMPLLSHHTALTEANGKIYVMGGFVLPQGGTPAWQPIDNAWEYDPASDTWKALPAMPTKRGAAVAAAVEGKIYVIGGAGTHPGSRETAVHPARPHRSMSANEVYDPATNSWTVRSGLPTARNHAAIGVVNNKIYVIGGRIGAAFMATPASSTDLVEEYDPAADQWGPLKKSMPTPRSAVSWGTHKGLIYVVGGEARDEKLWGAFIVVEALDPVANRWMSLPPMPIPRHGHAGAVVGNRLHVVSGDVQSLGASKPKDVRIETDVHIALDLPSQ